MSKTIAIMATLDTKGEEVKYLKEQIERGGKKVFIIDMGLRGIPAAIPTDVTREMLAQASGSTMAVFEKKSGGKPSKSWSRALPRCSGIYTTRANSRECWPSAAWTGLCSRRRGCAPCLWGFRNSF